MIQYEKLLKHHKTCGFFAVFGYENVQLHPTWLCKALPEAGGLSTRLREVFMEAGGMSTLLWKVLMEVGGMSTLLWKAFTEVGGIST